MRPNPNALADPRLVAVPVYAAALLLGFTLVTVPASSALLIAGLGLSSARYGSLFVPQLAGALLCGIGLAILGRKASLRAMLLVAIACLTMAQLLLGASQFVDAQTGYGMLLAVMLLVGGGIGIGGGPLNAYPALLFPRYAGAALTAVHVVAGLGMMTSPLYHAFAAAGGHWIAGLIGAGLFGLLVLAASAVVRLPVTASGPVTDTAPPGLPTRDAAIWLLVAAATIYSIAEGIFSNWAILYLQGRGFDAATTSFALTAFLGGITAGRLIASFLVVRIQPVRFLWVLPLAIALAFLLLPRIGSPASAIMAFGFAGLACSAYFPMLITYAAVAHAAAVGWIATLMITAQMAGIGLGAYVVGAFVGLISFERLYVAATILPAATLLLLFLASRVRHRLSYNIA